MSKTNHQDILIGTVDEATILFTYPNNSSEQSLEHTIEHWFSQTLKRDFLDTLISCTVEFEGSFVFLQLKGTTDVAKKGIEAYADILPKFLAAGLKAHNEVIPKIIKEEKWDPRDKNWRFFMPLGLSMVNNKALHFFHYPPQKMLELQNYLDDPVPHRIENLMTECGVSDRDHAQAYECIVDGAPIAAPDDEGSAQSKDPDWGNIPIQYFEEYQKEMVTALLKPHPKHKGYTIPIVVFGSHPRKIFAKQFIDGQDNLGVNEVHVIEILKGWKTPIIGSNHPYRFYAQAQKNQLDKYRKVGNGRLNMDACKNGLPDVMRDDLITTDWTLKMVDDPLNPETLLAKVREFWHGSDGANTLCALTRSQSTLFYTDEEEILFKFVLNMPAARAECEKHGNKTCSFCT